MQKLTIIKIGGKVIDNEESLFGFLKLVSSLKGLKIMVHGGGKLATQLAEKLNIPVQMVDGRRITDAETLKITTMVYAGYINKTIVAHLQALNCNATGLSGADGNCITTTKRINASIDYGFVGDIKSVDNSFFKSLLEKKVTPVVCAITHDGKGQLLNTNADTIASAIAVAMSKEYETQLIYCFEKNGVLQNVEDNNSVIKNITLPQYTSLKSEGVINKGMIPKMDNAFEAISKGVKFVQIGKAESLLKLTNEHDYEGTRLQH